LYEPVDSDDDSAREDRLDTITNALSGLVAEVKAIKASGKAKSTQATKVKP